MKPNHIADYNSNMSGIDRSDQMISYYFSPRKSICWYEKVIIHVLDLRVWNSYYLYEEFHTNVKFLKFRESLIRCLKRLSKDISNGNQLISKVTFGRSQKISNTSFVSLREQH